MSGISSIKDRFCASYKEVDIFCLKVEKVVKELSLDKELFSLQLMLREGLLNAVKHGCNNQGSLKIDCSLLIYDNEYKIEIEDPGDGFNWGSPKHESNLDDSSGRGLSIIDKYSSSFYFNEKGNKLTIRKFLINGELTMGENNIVRDGSRGMLKLESNLVASVVEDLRVLVNNNIQEGLVELTIDLNGISVVDSMGIGFLISAHNSLLKLGGKIEVVHVIGEILDLFTSMRLDQHFLLKGE
ncbi:MAG: ATP-binding protein [Spirochaetales bacterium]|nr:ATP-binding protein [Spirochaetales bacterium]